MLNQTKMMEPLSATNVELGGESPGFLHSLNNEVESALKEFGADIIFLLIEKWERDLEVARADGKLTIERLLGHYVCLKISAHHLKRRYERDYDWDNPVMKDRIRNFNSKVKEARRNYYVAKRRVEGEHGSECDCRGCRCIKEFGR